MANHTEELNDAQLEVISGGFLDATLGSSVLGDGSPASAAASSTRRWN